MYVVQIQGSDWLLNDDPGYDLLHYSGVASMARTASRKEAGISLPAPEALYGRISGQERGSRVTSKLAAAVSRPYLVVILLRRSTFA